MCSPSGGERPNGVLSCRPEIQSCCGIRRGSGALAGRSRWRWRELRLGEVARNRGRQAERDALSATCLLDLARSGGPCLPIAWRGKPDRAGSDLCDRTAAQGTGPPTRRQAGEHVRCCTNVLELCACETDRGPRSRPSGKSTEERLEQRLRHTEYRRGGHRVVTAMPPTVHSAFSTDS